MLQDLFRSATVNDRSKVAVVDGSRRITYGELQEAAMAFASQLHTLGARCGDRVVLTLPNGIDAAITLWGTLELGAVMVPLHVALKGDALRATLEDADPHWIVASPGVITPRTPTSGEDSTDLAALIYTSGTTGEPKGVMLTHASMTAAIQMVNDYLRIIPGDVIHSALPLSSSYGLYQLLLGLAAGATVLLDRGFAFPASCLALAARERATVMAAVPTMLGWMAQSPLLDRLDLGSLRMITSAAAALPAAQALQLRKRLPQSRLFVMYGQTECKRISFLDPEEIESHADSVGKGLPGQEHQVVDASGDPVPPGEVGELVVRGPHVMRGYWRKPVETAEKLRPLGAGSEPWMFTGDGFAVDTEGYLRFAGRLDEIMKIGGHKVSPAEIESVLCQHPDVLEAAVIGIPDQQWGQVAAAFIVPAEGSTHTAEDMKRWCSQKLRGHMVPRVFRFLETLPKTPSGKILKRAIDTSALCPPGPAV
jgi:acyl-CoA synthetase (AMP-forming)/AMP-acid ligase II